MVAAMSPAVKSAEREKLCSLATECHCIEGLPFIHSVVAIQDNKLHACDQQAGWSGHNTGKRLNVRSRRPRRVAVSNAHVRSPLLRLGHITRSPNICNSPSDLSSDRLG